jgi:uncharacterized Ntn-hydrolase superfamily protein
MTLALLGRCPRTGMAGVVITSSSPAVAARCAFVRPGTGVATTQNVTDPRLGPALLDAMEDGASAAEAVDRVAAAAPGREHRQLAAIDARGGAGAYTGERALGRHGHRLGTDCVAAANLLADEAVLDALVTSFAAAPDAHLAARLLAALDAGLAAGGEEGPVRSAGLLVGAEVPWPVADLRVDWHDDPAAELRALWEVWEPQLSDYVTRALHPERAPAFGVPGDEPRR